jgi:hypothetical protein
VIRCESAADTMRRVRGEMTSHKDVPCSLTGTGQ